MKRPQEDTMEEHTGHAVDADFRSAELSSTDNASEEFTDADALEWNYRERVNLLTDVVVGILGMLVAHPAIPVVAGQEFVTEMGNVQRRLAELREGARQ
jgi:hypothetical protein